jgi:hypothetical protein
MLTAAAAGGGGGGDDVHETLPNAKENGESSESIHA